MYIYIIISYITAKSNAVTGLCAPSPFGNPLNNSYRCNLSLTRHYKIFKKLVFYSILKLNKGRHFLIHPFKSIFSYYFSSFRPSPKIQSFCKYGTNEYSE